MTPSVAPLIKLVVLASLLASCPGHGDDTGTTEAATTSGTAGSSSDAQATTGDMMTTPTTEPGTTDVEATGTGTTTGGTTGGTGGTTDDDVDFACEDTGGDTTGDTEGPVCACILDDLEGGWNDAPSLPTCGETLCPIVQAEEFECFPGCGPDGGLILANPEALVCALTALRDRTPGIVRWNWSKNGGQYSFNGYVWIRDDGMAVRRFWGAEDLNYVVGDARFGTMPEACAFAQCLAASSAMVRFDCLRQFPLEHPLGQCDDGWTVYP